jgi:hypothetical protein
MTYLSCMEEALQKAIDLIGGPAAVGKLFDPQISGPAVSQWEKAPANRVLVIEAATNGQVTRHDLRPDIFGPAPGEPDGGVEPNKPRPSNRPGGAALKEVA